MKSSPKFLTRKDIPSRHARFLNSCIKIEEERISRQVSIPRRVYFELDLDVINKISDVKAESGSLYLSPLQLTELRYYSSINSPLAANIAGINRHELSLTFSSNYLLATNQKHVTVVRSTINLTGEISQEIHRDLWQNKQLSSQVIQAHHWLTAEILRQLPLERNAHSYLIFWLLWLFTAIAFSPLVWLFSPFSFLFKLIANLVCLWLSQKLIRHLVHYRFKQWIINHLIHGWLSNKTIKRQLGFRLLTFL